jgi:RNA polymerase sigma-70 factor (ECF subfamily)
VGADSRQLLERLRGDDVAALDAALRLYWNPLRGYLTRWLGSADAAEDVAQQTFLKLWERRGEWRLEGSLRGLLFRVARNLAISDQRNLAAKRRAHLQFALQRPPPLRGALDRLQDHELGAALDAAIAQLPARRREVFVLRCINGLSYREIAAAMQISEQTVANQLNRALTTLRERLAGLL